MCDTGVQQQGSEVPEGGAGCASLWVCVQPEEHGGRGGEHLIKSGAYTRLCSQRHACILGVKSRGNLPASLRSDLGGLKPSNHFTFSI